MSLAVQKEAIMRLRLRQRASQSMYQKYRTHVQLSPQLSLPPQLHVYPFIQTQPYKVEWLLYSVVFFCCHYSNHLPSCLLQLYDPENLQATCQQETTLSLDTFNFGPGPWESLHHLGIRHLRSRILITWVDLSVRFLSELILSHRNGPKSHFSATCGQGSSDDRTMNLD
jgi:hypothetical protein